MTWLNRPNPYAGGGILGGAKTLQDSAQSIPNSTWTAVSDRSSPQVIVSGTVMWPTNNIEARVQQAGWWMVGASLAWSANATGRRVMGVETWTGTDPGVNSGETIILSEAATGPGGRIVINGQTIVNLEANTNVRLLGWQNSGGALSTYSLGPTELWLTRIL